MFKYNLKMTGIFFFFWGGGGGGDRYLDRNRKTIIRMLSKSRLVA